MIRCSPILAAESVAFVLLVSVFPAEAAALVGDGVIDGAEECDDTNMAAGDGCDDLGQVEPGFICVDEPSTCCVQVHTEGDRTFYYCDPPFGIPQANAASLCSDADGTLAQVTNATINAGVTPGSGGAVWVDGDDIAVEGEWRYTDDTLVTYFNWEPTEPDGATGENCIHILDDGFFRDVGCGIPLDFVCEVVGGAVCGDRATTGDEECDDGNVSNQDACLNNCLDASCGDGFRWRDMEECDDGNTVDGDACDADCTKPDLPPAPREGGDKKSGGCSLDTSAQRADPFAILAVLALALLRRSTHNRTS